MLSFTQEVLVYSFCLTDFVSIEHYNKYQQYLTRNTDYINMISFVSKYPVALFYHSFSQMSYSDTVNVFPDFREYFYK